jgi:AMIN domain
MSIRTYIGALSAVLAIVSSPCSAQQKSSPNPARVQHLVVRGTGVDMEVEIQTSGAPISPAAQTITGPDRIVIDFPSATPAAELRALQVNRGPLKSVRVGLFSNDPPTTRVVLDLIEPHGYHISTIQNAIVVKLGAVDVAQKSDNSSPATAAHIQNAALATPTRSHQTALDHVALNQAASNPATANPVKSIQPAVPQTLAAIPSVPNAVSSTAPLPVVTEPPPSPKPLLTVNFLNGLLSIRSDKATLAQVLYEVQRQTHAEIAIPAGAEQEQVAADLGPAPARDVLGTLLNGSPYNFIFVGKESTLEQVILTRRDNSLF